MIEKLAGSCLLCGRKESRLRIENHLAGCAASGDDGTSPEDVVVLRIEAAGAPDYWLVAEGRTRASFQQLDDLLRRVWLECCGHLSAFRVHRRAVSKRSTLGAVLPEKGSRFDYDYDFGSTTSLKGTVLGFRVGSIGRRAVRLLARNSPLAWTCEDCPEAAEVLCPVCEASGDAWIFCPSHAEAHPCAPEGVYMPVVNSPRMGVCGYAGERLASGDRAAFEPMSVGRGGKRHRTDEGQAAR